MTSMLPEANSSAVKMKQKLLNDRPVKEETRSFLSFSRENLSISQSDLEQGFNRSRLRPTRNTILSTAALVIAILCLAIESWKLRCLTANTHDIDELKRDMEELQHRFVKQNLMNDLKAFEEQLYGEKSTEDEDPGEADIDYADYDTNYDDDSSASHDYSGELAGNQHVPLTYGSRPSDFPEITSTPVPTSTKPFSDLTLQLMELMTKAKHEQELEKNRENHKNIERKRLKEEHRARGSHEEKSSDASGGTKRKRDTLSAGYLKSRQKDTDIKRKRSASDYATTTDHYSTSISNYEPNDRRRAKETPKKYPRASNENDMDEDPGTNLAASTVSWDVHPPKKYHAHARLDVSSSADDDQLSEEIARPNQHSRERIGRVGGRGINWRRAEHRDAVVVRNGTDVEVAQNYEVAGTEPTRKLTRRHLRAPRQVCAIHYEADFNLFSAQDERDDNGKIRHHRGIFKAWRPSDWVAELGMNRYFTLSRDGEITVQETGLYLTYAQIHYVDEHDDNGFHLLVNGDPILQCMVHTPGTGHKSRSCFSARVTFLQAGDRLVLKEVGGAKYALFHREKSFLGLAKLGEMRLQQKHPT